MWSHVGTGLCLNEQGHLQTTKRFRKDSIITHYEGLIRTTEAMALEEDQTEKKTLFPLRFVLDGRFRANGEPIGDLQGCGGAARAQITSDPDQVNATWDIMESQRFHRAVGLYLESKDVDFPSPADGGRYKILIATRDILPGEVIRFLQEDDYWDGVLENFLDRLVGAAEPEGPEADDDEDDEDDEDATADA